MTLKTCRPHLLGILLALLAAASSSAAVLTWTNTSGGDWSWAANWSPNQVPGALDTADITASGSYTVTFDTNAIIEGLVLGGDDGTQTFLLASNTLTINGTALIYSNGAFSLSGGVLAGTNAVISGLLTWSNGSIAAGSILTLATNSTLLITGTNGSQLGLYGTLTNAGTVRMTSGNLDCCGVLVNLPGALVDIQANLSIRSYTCSTGVLLNQGVLQKSGGTGSSVIVLSTFENFGLVDAQTGILSVASGNGAGVYEADAGARLSLQNYAFYDGSQFVGSGTNLLSGGAFTFNGVLMSSNAVLSAGTLAATNAFLTGRWTWTGTSIDSGTTLTVETNSVLVVGPPGVPYLAGTLTNAGTIQMLNGSDLAFDGCYGGVLINLPGALVDIQAVNEIEEGCRGALWVNQGSVRKSAGTIPTRLQLQFNNPGLLDVQAGTLSLSGGCNLTNGVLNVGISGTTNFGVLSLTGSAALAGTFSANLTNGFVPATGNSFAVVTYGSRTGAFTNISLPALPANEQWQASYGTNSFVLSVLPKVPPVINSVSLTDGNLVLSGSGGLPGGPYYILSSTNLSLPLTNWTVIATNTFDSSGNFIFTNTVNQALVGNFFTVSRP